MASRLYRTTAVPVRLQGLGSAGCLQLRHANAGSLSLDGVDRDRFDPIGCAANADMRSARLARTLSRCAQSLAARHALIHAGTDGLADCFRQVAGARWLPGAGRGHC